MIKMITKYKQFNEGLLNHLSGPTKEELIKDLKDKNPERLLDIGLQQNDFELVKSGIENGAHLDYTRRNPLVNLGMSENWERLKLYMDNDIYLTSDYNLLLKNYAHINDVNILKILIQDCDVKRIGDVALKVACFNGSYESVQLLIDSGVDVNCFNSFTLRELVSYSNPDYKMIELLLDNGANPHVNNDSLFKTDDEKILNLLKKY